LIATGARSVLFLLGYVLAPNLGSLLQAALVREPWCRILVAWPEDEQLNGVFPDGLATDTTTFSVVLGHSQDNPQRDTILPLSFPLAAPLLRTCLTRI